MPAKSHAKPPHDTPPAALREDVFLPSNGVPCVQIEMKTLGFSPRRAMEQIVGYKNDPGNGYTRTLLCFLQIFIVSNRDANKATTMGHIQRGHLTAAKVLIPPRPLLDAMTTTISPLIDQIIANRTQSRTLATLRDTLLPQLLSGSLQINNRSDQRHD